MKGGIDRALFLRPETQPLLLDDAGAMACGEFERAIRAAGIDDENFVGKTRAEQTGLKLRRGIERDDGN
jgi:hypothetical protein